MAAHDREKDDVADSASEVDEKIEEAESEVERLFRLAFSTVDASLLAKKGAMASARKVSSLSGQLGAPPSVRLKR
jgi:hypothetical protein